MAESRGFPVLAVAACAILITLFPMVVQLLASVLVTLSKALRSPLQRCERLEWHQIPEGPLHQCSSPHKHCPHLGTMDSDPGSEAAIASFFNRTRRGHFARKPKQLSPLTPYARTDTKTLKALLSLMNLRNRSDCFVFKEVQGVMTAYIRNLSQFSFSEMPAGRLDVSRLEMELILNGYPPWYQNPLALAGGRSVPHPIRDIGDLPRGGWIVAVGMSPTLPVNVHFMEVQEQDHKDTQIKAVSQALDGMICCLGHLEEAFPDNKRLGTAQKLMRMIKEHNRYSRSVFLSAFRRSVFARDFGDGWNQRRKPSSSLTDQDFTEELSTDQIITAMHVFNNYDKPREEETEELRPVLGIVLRAAMLGAFQVVNHLYMSACPSGSSTLPSQLDNDGFVYIRGQSSPLVD